MTMIVIMTVVGIETGIGIVITVIGTGTGRKSVSYMIETGTETETEIIIAVIEAVIDTEIDMVIVIGGEVDPGAEAESGVIAKETAGLARCPLIVREGKITSPMTTTIRIPPYSKCGTILLTFFIVMKFQRVLPPNPHERHYP
jgi:hypothetical protein